MTTLTMQDEKRIEVLQRVFRGDQRDTVVCMGIRNAPLRLFDDLHALWHRQTIRSLKPSAGLVESYPEHATLEHNRSSILPSAAFLEIWPAPDSCDPKAGRWM